MNIGEGKGGEVCTAGSKLPGEGSKGDMDGSFVQRISNPVISVLLMLSGRHVEFNMIFIRF